MPSYLCEAQNRPRGLPATLNSATTTTGFMWEAQNRPPVSPATLYVGLFSQSHLLWITSTMPVCLCEAQYAPGVLKRLKVDRVLQPCLTLLEPLRSTMSDSLCTSQKAASGSASTLLDGCLVQPGYIQICLAPPVVQYFRDPPKLGPSQAAAPQAAALMVE